MEKTSFAQERSAALCAGYSEVLSENQFPRTADYVAVHESVVDAVDGFSTGT
jgi:hypothetical protein